MLSVRHLDEFLKSFADARDESHLTGFQNMEGCHSYILAKDPADEVSVWMTEIWDSQESHDVSVALPRIQKVIAEAKPLMSGRELRVVTEPIGGQGL